MNIKEEILEVTIKFVIAGLGNSWILHECLSRYNSDDISHDEILYRLNYGNCSTIRKLRRQRKL